MTGGAPAAMPHAALSGMANREQRPIAHPWVGAGESAQILETCGDDLGAQHEVWRPTRFVMRSTPYSPSSPRTPACPASRQFDITD